LNVSYQVFARKYRPQIFDDVLGQDHVVRTLKNAVEQNRLAHAYLFVGPRGTGKTSTARILAKAVNCEKGPTVTPCGVCDSCREISQGISLDVLEIDGASNNSVDQVRELRENVRFAPVRGRYKIYIIDEVHMLTQQAFNALLKTLEEPPAHVKFVFATTEPHKVLPTILSRCQRFDLRRIPAQIIAKHLLFIAQQEQVSLSAAAADAIALAADGGLRDAESMLDQLVAFCGTDIGEAQVLDVFGLTSEQVVADLAEAVVTRNSGKALAAIHSQSDAGKDLTKLLTDLLAYLRNLLIYQVDPASLREEISGLAKQTLQRLSTSVETARLLRLIEQISETEGAIKWASNKKLHLEIAVIRAIQTLEEVALESVISALEALRDPAAGPIQQPPRGTQPRPVSMEGSRPAAAGSVPPLAESPSPAAADPATVERATPEAAKPPAVAPVAPPRADSPPTVDVVPATGTAFDPGAIWSEVMRLVRQQRPLIVAWLDTATPLAAADGKFIIGFPEDQSVALESVLRAGNRQFVEELLAQITDSTWVLEGKQRTGLPERPAPDVPGPDPIEQFKKDPLIQKALEIFQAEIQAGE
jgi:DNA polymerase-3 subunit gamma/tau